MAEYINRATLLQFISEALEGNAYCDDAVYEYVLQGAKNLPAVDATEVVRCKDCKWCHAGYCEKYDDLIPLGCANKPWEDWFCADGEKKNG